MNFLHLAFCGNMPLEPSWYIMDNLSDSRKKDVLQEFQVFLVDKKLAQEKNVFFYALWASKFLTFTGELIRDMKAIKENARRESHVFRPFHHRHQHQPCYRLNFEPTIRFRLTPASDA